MPSATHTRAAVSAAAAVLSASIAITAPAAPVLAGEAPAAPVVVRIDASPAKQHPISPLIYGIGGIGSLTEADLAALNSPLHRQGGNTMTTYNWKQNAANLASDWFYESYPFASATAGAEADTFVARANRLSARSMITVPMIGYVAKLGPNRSVLPSFSVRKYGPQQSTDYWYPDAGNGVKPDGTFLTGNNSADSYITDTPTSERTFVKHLTDRFGPAAAAGPAYYLTDNEMSIWFGTHRDIRPVGLHATEARDAIVSYAAAIHAVDPTAKVAGPEEWGWSAFSLSGYDQQWGPNHGWTGPFPDHDGPQHGIDYLAWLLGALKQKGRPLDVFTVHYYPQSGEFSSDTSPAMQALRNESTRELWDPTYTSKSWIGDRPRLVRRLKSLVSTQYYADTPVGVTEYSWGADDHINGATAQADILGIFGREGLDLATRWGVPGPSTPTYKAMQIYRNYDLKGHGFGETGLAATVPNPDRLSAFAALRGSDGAMTVVIVNKSLAGSTGATQSTTLALQGFTAKGTAQIYQLTAANVIRHLPGQTFSGTSVTIPTPTQSVTMVILPPG